MGTRLVFGVLGPVRIWTDGGELGVSAVKLRSLLAVLVLRAGHAVPVDELYEVAWEGSPPARARAALHTAMTRLRQSLGPTAARRLVSSHPGYLLEALPEETDSGRFLRDCELGRQALRGTRRAEAADLLQQALGLWRGGFLADVPGPYLHDHYGRHLAETRLQALEWQGEAELALGHQEKLLPGLRALTAEHPLRERFHGQLMVALYRSGRTAEALEAYRRCRTAIRHELGVEPSPHLRELHQRVLAEDPALTQPPAAVTTTRRAFPTPAQLPYDLADFTGREEHVQQLHDVLDPRSGAAIAVIAGPGGVGKTSLAVHVAHRARYDFPDGQLYLDLRGVSAEPLTPLAVAAQVIRSLGLAPGQVPTDEAECLALYRSLLAQRRVLLVLDNARDTAQVRPLLPGGAASAVLVTSRSRLAGLPATHRIDLTVLTGAGARALFGRIVGLDRLAAEPAATTAVLRACAGLPLALRVAASRLTAHPSWTITTLATRIGDHLRRLDELQLDDLAVRASLDLGYAGLAAPQARALRLLGLWDGTDLALTAAAALLGEHPRAAERTLAVLTDAHLLEESAPGRYRFHDLVRLYAAERARQEEPAASRQAALHRLASWYLHTGAAAATALQPTRRLPEAPPPAPGEPAPLPFADHDDALAWYDTERDNLATAVQHAAEAGLHTLCWQLPVTLLGFHQRRRTWTQWLATYDLGLAAARALGDRPAEARVLNGLGLAYRDVHRHEKAVSCYERSLLICRETGNHAGEGSALNNLGNSLLRLGRHEESHHYFRLNLELVRTHGNPAEETAGLSNLANLLQDLGRYEEAVEHLEQALAISQEAGLRHYEGIILCNLGDVYNDMRQLVTAEAWLRAALPPLREVGDRHTEAVALGHLARSLTCSGRHQQAKALLHEALAIFTELDAPEAAEIRARLGEHAPAHR
ncbi:BTAD domain-containing putative transcriptional regulator [Kitasatospora sp. NPDC002227]|uniref:AfsR/SARP family transcriptional regulator n=1 Tax=Kitasatospora sp. NPDC002227 TaxID=3154773 RepID=UPI00331DEDD2